MSLIDFIAESNRIEGIRRAPTNAEIEAHEMLLARPSIKVVDLEGFVHVVQPDARLRREAGDDVYITGSDRVIPAGGPMIVVRLSALLEQVDVGAVGAYAAHVQYECLHPFRDGNGRSGRALWAWMMQRSGRDPFALSFLRCWYYQSLDAADGDDLGDDRETSSTSTTRGDELPPEPDGTGGVRDPRRDSINGRPFRNVRGPDRERRYHR